MGVIKYGNLTHILSILVLFLITAILFIILKGRKLKTKKIFIFILMVLNLGQHLFKSYVWYPLYHGQGFSQINTAYNMCALLIIITPLLFFTNIKVLKEGNSYFGAFAGGLAIIVPYWFIGSNIFTISYLRFYTCHSLLFITSVLSFLTFKPKFYNFFFYGLVFILDEALILLNNGLYQYIVNKSNFETIFNSLYNSNALWICHPPKEFPIYGKIINAITPKFLLMLDETHYRPILYNAVPLYLIVTLLGFGTNSILSDRKAERYSKISGKQKYSGKDVQSGNYFIK